MLGNEFRGPSPSVGLRLMESSFAVPLSAISYIKMELNALELINQVSVNYDEETYR